MSERGFHIPPISPVLDLLAPSIAGHCCYVLVFSCFTAVSFVFQFLLLSFMGFSLSIYLLLSCFLVETFLCSVDLLVLFGVVWLFFNDSD
jgi:hypothetical protein